MTKMILTGLKNLGQEKKMIFNNLIYQIHYLTVIIKHQDQKGMFNQILFNKIVH